MASSYPVDESSGTQLQNACDPPTLMPRLWGGQEVEQEGGQEVEQEGGQEVCTVVGEVQGTQIKSPYKLFLHRGCRNSL